jgi:Flp pilus assembly pilin Flp
VIRKLRVFRNDRSGATALEYAIITGLVIAASLLALQKTGTFVTGGIGTPGNYLGQLSSILQNLYGQAE